jgi:hypothetical protein
MENTPPIQNNKQQRPKLLLVVCYYIIIKAGVKALMSLIFLIGGKSLGGLTKQEGFDTISNGGTNFQLLIIALSAISIWAAVQVLNFKQIGFYVYLAIVIVSFFAPIFFHTGTYQPSMIGFTISIIPIALLLRYKSKLS